MSAENIFIRVIEPKDTDTIGEFLRNFFYTNEPITTCPGLSFSADEEFLLSGIPYGTCLMATERNENTEEIVGVLMAGPNSPNEVNILFEMAAKEGSTKWGQILHLLATTEHRANVFERYGVSKALLVQASCVHPEKRGLSISKLLKQEVMVLGRKLGYPLITADSTSFYSARINEQLGWECVHQLRYDEYLDKDGKQIFNPPAPHGIVKTFAKRL